MSTPHAAAAPLPLPAETEFNEAEVLRQMVDIIVREADPEAIILFGSRARGDAGPDSDVDLLIIEREPFGRGRSRIREAARLYHALRYVPASKDLLVYSRDEFQRWKEALNHVVANAVREGRLLYGNA
ncbi:nucleotidyltransferase domain-containing protein [uncultured Thiodictyon sp.]|jgi:predicted nucleotidyltransferase|uniref:nucleotidyltransferase domain-containing protein n=1 Tax=uncultured Thiodictyon sp. TaxID=1846217 RepID=UPI0025D29622|nr:nucleotidyltransferase domain-containing protein [uncultured Thiodictyon sp.]